MIKQISFIFSSNIFRIIVFISLFIYITNHVYSRFVKPINDEKLAVNLETIENHDFDVIFMSNSYLFTAYDPLLLNGITGLTSIHTGTPARRFCYEPFILSQILKRQQPKMIVVDVSNASLFIPNSDQIWYFNNMAISNFNLTLDKVQLLKDIIPENNLKTWLQSVSTTSSILYGLTTEGELKYHKKNNNPNEGKVLGYDSRIKQNLEKLGDSKINFDQLYQKSPGRKSNSSEVLNSINLEKLNELLDIAEENLDVEFLLVNSIKLDASSENQSLIDHLKDKVQLYENVNVLELNSNQVKRKLDLKFEDFYDFGHLTQSGSIKLTSYFAEYLTRNYDFLMGNNVQANYKFKILGSDNVFNVRNIKVLFADNYNPDIRIVLDSIPKGFEQMNTIVSIYPKAQFKDLLTDKAKENKWKSDNSYRRLKNYIPTINGLVGKLNSWSKLKPEQIDRITIKFSGDGIITETKELHLNEVNIFQKY